MNAVIVMFNLYVIQYLAVVAFIWKYVYFGEDKNCLFVILVELSQEHITMVSALSLPNVFIHFQSVHQKLFSLKIRK